MKKIKNLFIILLSACLVNTWPVYAEEQEYVSEEEREFYEYFNLKDTFNKLGYKAEINNYTASRINWFLYICFITLLTGKVYKPIWH